MFALISPRKTEEHTRKVEENTYYSSLWGARRARARPARIVKGTCFLIVVRTLSVLGGVRDLLAPSHLDS